jgi:hypothetical protein
MFFLDDIGPEVPKSTGITIDPTVIAVVAGVVLIAIILIVGLNIKKKK